MLKLDQTAVALAARTRASVISRLGLSMTNWKMLETIGSREWLYRSRGRLPRGRLELGRANPVAAAEVALCERLIDAYAAASGERPPGEQTTGMWSLMAATHQQALAAALERRDAAELARMLAGMFQADFIHGITSGDLILHSQSRLGARIWWLRSLDGLAGLAEALGAAPAENPEQGGVARAFEHGIDDLVERIERELEVGIGFPDVGAPHGIRVGERVITLDSPEQIHAAVRLRDAIRLHVDADRSISVVEIGGGYGGMAYWFLRLCGNVDRYVIVDLPIVNVLQGYFLAKSLGPSSVSLLGEAPQKVRVLPSSALPTIETPYDVLVNKNSMPEMPAQVMLDYLQWARATCSAIFYSYNHEAATPIDGTPQNVVPAAVAQIGGFRRIRREPSWLRRGYVEEIYLRASPAGR